MLGSQTSQWKPRRAEKVSDKMPWFQPDAALEARGRQRLLNSQPWCHSNQEKHKNEWVYPKVTKIFLHTLVCLRCQDKTSQTGWLKKQIFITRSSGGWKSQIKVHQGSVSDKGCLPDLWVTTSSSHNLFFVLMWGESSLSLSLLIGPPILLDQGPNLMTPLNLNYLLKFLSPNAVTVGEGSISTYELGATQFSPWHYH